MTRYGVWSVTTMMLIVSLTLADRLMARPPVRHAAPNILLVTADCLRTDYMGCYGDKRGYTPVMDALAAQGTLYTRAGAQSDFTTSSTITLMSSRWLSQVYVHSNLREPTIATVLKANGYDTAGIAGTLALTDDRVFDGIDFKEMPTADTPEARWAAAEVTNRAVPWLEQRSPTRPWFLWLTYWDLHNPSPDYEQGLTEVDRSIGAILKAIEERGELRNTIIVLTAQHGYDLEDRRGLAGHGLYEESLHVPLILVRPARAAAGTVVTEPVMLVDLLPTLLSLSNIAPVECVGVDLTRPFPSARPRFAEGTNLESRSVLVGRWKFIEFIKNYSLGPVARVFSGVPDPDHPGDFIVRAKGTRELYDLDADPGELNNVASSHPDVVAELHQAVDTWQAGRGAATDTANVDPKVKRALQKHGYF